MPAAALTKHHVTFAGRADGPVLLFAHGFGCDQNMWQRILPAFADDYRIVLFDHVGAGRSDLSAYDAEAYRTLERYATDVVELCADLDLTEVTVVGHSVGASIAAHAVTLAPERFARLILVAPSPRFLDDAESGYVGGFSEADIDGLLESLDNNYFAWAATMAPVVMGNPETPALGGELEASFCRTDPEIAYQFARVTFLSDSRTTFAAVRTPTLVLQCSNDLLAPLTVGQFVHEAIAGSRLVQLAATGHCPQVSAPAETATAIQAFLAETP